MQRGIMGGNLQIALVFWLAVLELLDRSDGKRRQHANIRQMQPQDVRCEDRNLQREVIWQHPKRIKREWGLQKYAVGSCVSYNCAHYANASCYEDENHTKLVEEVTKTGCRLSISQMAPWGLYNYKVSAIYQKKANHSKIRAVSVTKLCPPVDRNMKLDPPEFELIRPTTTTISIVYKLPTELENAIRDSGSYDLRIAYSLCLTESGKSCRKENLRNATCDPSFTFSNLKEGTLYNVSAWYTTRASGKLLQSAVASKEIATPIDYFPAQAQILLVIGISTILILSIVALLVWREVRKYLKKWEALVNKELPKYFEDALKDIPRMQSIVDVSGVFRCTDSFRALENELALPKIKIILKTTPSETIVKQTVSENDEEIKSEQPCVTESQTSHTELTSKEGKYESYMREKFPRERTDQEWFEDGIGAYLKKTAAVDWDSLENEQLMT